MKFRHQKYIYQKPFGHEKHWWQVVGPGLSIHFHVSINENYGDNAGLECHWHNPPSYMKDDAPVHFNCDLTGGRCWHDRTSLYATETLWPIIKAMLQSQDHEAVFRLLEGEIKTRLKENAGELE